MSESARYSRSELGQRGHNADSNSYANTQPDRQSTEHDSTKGDAKGYTSYQQS